MMERKMSVLESSFKVESGIQLLARLSRKPVVENFYPELFQSGPKQSEVIELLSDVELNSLLVDITCAALLPVCVNGPEAGVLLFTCSGHFCYDTLVACMRKKILVQLNNLSIDSTNHHNSTSIDDLLLKVMTNLFIVEIYDSNQLYATIYNLENILMEHSNISILIFDTITAFYWSEQSFKMMKMDTYLKKLLQTIQRTTNELKVTIIYTRPEYFCSNKDVKENIELAETPTVEKINYRIQITQNSDNIYQANIKTSKMQITRSYRVIDNKLFWI